MRNIHTFRKKKKKSRPEDCSEVIKMFNLEHESQKQFVALLIILNLLIEGILPIVLLSWYLPIKNLNVIDFKSLL